MLPGGGGGLRDPPTQNLGKPGDPELSHSQRGGGGMLDSQPPTHPPTHQATKAPAESVQSVAGLARSVSAIHLGVGNAGRFLMKPPGAPTGFEAATRDLCSPDLKRSHRAFSRSATSSPRSESAFTLCLEMETAADSTVGEKCPESQRRRTPTGGGGDGGCSDTHPSPPHVPQAEH